MFKVTSGGTYVVPHSVLDMNPDMMDGLRSPSSTSTAGGRPGLSSYDVERLKSDIDDSEFESEKENNEVERLRDTPKEGRRSTVLFRERWNEKEDRIRQTRYVYVCGIAFV